MGRRMMEQLQASELAHRFDRLRNKFSRRDTRMHQLRTVREGRVSEVAPDLFPVAGPWQEPIVANMIDVAARDMAEMIAPLPAFNCSSPSMASESARRKATLRSKIATGYVAHSDLQVQMYTAADRYVTYGMMPVRVEIDHDARMPYIRCLDPVGSYPDMDRFGRLRSFYQRVLVPREDLCDLFPERAAAIRKATGAYGSHELEVVLYHDKDADIAFLHSLDDPVELARTTNPLGKPMVVIVQRPGATEVPRGQFDDVIFVQLAKAKFALLALQAASESVNAPLVVPTDVPDIGTGPGAVIRTANPQGVGRVPLNVPAEVFAEQAQLDRELQTGARFPSVRTGNMDSSIVTGKGVQALMGGYDSQIRGHQAVWAAALAQVVSLCFQVDETVFRNEQKSLRGTSNGTPYQIMYTPRTAIAGDWTVDVQYGLMAGLDPNRWLVFALQARAEKLFSRDFMRREMPVDMDAEEEARKVDLEDLEESAKMAIQGYAQAIPALAAAGQDPAGPVEALAKVIDLRRKGASMSEAVVQAFGPEEPDEAEAMADSDEAAPPQGGAMMVPPDQQGGGVRGIQPDGRLQGVAPGMQGELPGGRPDLQMMLASLDARGNPNIQAGISRQRAV